MKHCQQLIIVGVALTQDCLAVGERRRKYGMLICSAPRLEMGSCHEIEANFSIRKMFRTRTLCTRYR